MLKAFRHLSIRSKLMVIILLTSSVVLVLGFLAFFVNGAIQYRSTLRQELIALADIIGKSVVVHKDPDDFKTQPAGNSGPRVACGVIRAA